MRALDLLEKLQRRGQADRVSHSFSQGSSAFHIHNMAMVQNQWYHFGIGAPPIIVNFSGDWDAHWGYGVLIHGHFVFEERAPHRRIALSSQEGLSLPAVVPNGSV